MKTDYFDPLPVCEECGAVNYGNASCVHCHRAWTATWGHIPCPVCDPALGPRQ